MPRIRTYDIVVSVPSGDMNPDVPDRLSVKRSISFNLDIATVSGAMDTALSHEFQGAVHQIRKALKTIGIEE